jgi:hypothetical protein
VDPPAAPPVVELQLPLPRFGSVDLGCFLWLMLVPSGWGANLTRVNLSTMPISMDMGFRENRYTGGFIDLSEKRGI